MVINTLPCHISNYTSGRSNPIRYLVIHYTGNNGDTAKDNATYFANHKSLGASAHYFIDEKEIWQSVSNKDTAWHCGAKKYIHAECRNINSIGIELCSRIHEKTGKYYFADSTVTNAANLVKELMKKFGIGAKYVVRHYDVTGKNCPAPFVEDIEAWKTFLKRLQNMREEDMMVRYERLEDIPNDNGFRDVIRTLMNVGIILGDGNGIIDLSNEQVRSLIFEYRGGAFDRKLIDMGMAPVVQI